MVFASICEHANSVCIFASTSSCQIFLASSELFRKIQMASSEHFEYFVNFLLAGISILLIGYFVLRRNKRCKPRAVQPVPPSYSQLCPAQ